MEEQPRITSTAPGHSGKRYSNFFFNNLFHSPYKQTPIKEGISSHQNSTKFLDRQTNIPLPDRIVRKPDCIPFEDKHYRTNVKKINDPNQIKLLKAMILFVLSIFFFSLYLLFIKPEVSLLLSVLFFSLAAYIFSTVFLRVFLNKKKNKNGIRSIETVRNKPDAQISQSSGHHQRPSDKFIVDTPNLGRADSNTPIKPINRKFMRADRPSATLEEKTTISSDDTSDELASETLRKLGIRRVVFNRYINNLKSFISRNLLAKIDTHSTDDESIKLMLNVPNMDHEAVVKRIKELSASQYMADNKGTKEDNQLVLHILSVWLSYKMSQLTDPKTQRLSYLIFSKNYLSIGKEPPMQKDNSIYLCINNDWNEFYVIFRQEEQVDRYYSIAESNSMYGALVIFFFLIRKHFDFLLGEADLQDPPLSMEAIFDSTI